MTQLDEPAAPPSSGRKRDHTRDPEILDAALDVLAETGYDGMTIDMVAARAKAGKATLYRRWASKAELVDRRRRLHEERPTSTSTHLPDTGTLRGDLVAMIKPHSIEDAREEAPGHGRPRLDALARPRARRRRERGDRRAAGRVNRLFLQRAIERGEIPADCDVETLALVSPSMAAYRVLIAAQAGRPRVPDRRSSTASSCRPSG